MFGLKEHGQTLPEKKVSQVLKILICYISIDVPCMNCDCKFQCNHAVKIIKNMKRAYSPKEIAARRWETLRWGEKWSKPFGEPADNASWFISGASASGKSSFVMQLAKELCKYGPVLYMSYEEGVNQSFQRRMDYLGMEEVQGRFRVVTDDTYDELVERLRKPKSPKFVIVDSFQVAADGAGFSYERAVALMKRFPKKCFIYIS